MSMPRTVVCDLDSTLCDTSHRHRTPNKDFVSWSCYAQECDEDTPILGTLKLLQMLSSAGYDIHYLTSRPESVRQKTMEWLKEYEAPWDGVLLMADEAECELVPSTFKLIKLGEYVATLGEGGLAEIALVIEDNVKLGKILNTLEVPTLLINPGYTKGEQ